MSEQQEREAATIDPDPVLLVARDQARAALTEITDAHSIGADDGHEVHEAHVLTLYFECRLAGYPGWRWAATLARVDEDSDVNVLEVELLPGAGAVVSPDWVPWSERLAQYRATQAKQAEVEAQAAAEAAAELDDDDDAEDDLLENDFSDFDDEIDGVELEAESDDESEGESAIDSDGNSDDDSDDSDDDEDEADSDDTDLFKHDPDDVDDDDDSEEESGEESSDDDE